MGMAPTSYHGLLPEASHPADFRIRRQQSESALMLIKCERPSPR